MGPIPPQPAVRAFIARLVMDVARDLPTRERERFFAAFPRERLELVEVTPRLGWIGFDRYMPLLETLLQVAGASMYRACCTRVMKAALQEPLLNILFTSALRLLGDSPRSFLKWTPKAYDLAFQHAGRFTFHQPAGTADRAELLFEGLPSEYLRSGAYTQAIMGCFEAYLELTGRSGSVSLARFDPSEGVAVIAISWPSAPGG